VQRPRPPIWFAGWVEPALRRAGRLGDAWLGGPSATLDECAGCVRTYRDAGGEGVALMRYVFVAESLERARVIAGAAFIRSFEETYFRWPHPVVKRPPGEPTIARLSEERIILGDPASCVRQIERFRSELGMTHLICRMSVAGIPAAAANASMDLFTREVMPALKGA
jgi:alkanesulfonate monooxygenase SsuD/methylene tetrahydromethanopterin reductase-like flavin-dependent oxidoreductase (luciferase family)